MFSSPDTLCLLLTWLVSMIKSKASEFNFWGGGATWPWLIVVVLPTRAEFLKLSDYSTLINYTFSFCTTYVFNCFRGVIAKFERVKPKFPKLSSHKQRGLKQCSTCQCTNYHDTTNHSWYLAWLELLRSRDICCANKYVATKIWQKF